MKWIIHARERVDIVGSTRAVLYALASRADQSGAAWPSVAQLALDSGVARRTALRCLRELELAGLIVVERTNGRASRYMLTGVRESPVSERHRCQSDTGGVSESHGGGVIESPVREREESREESSVARAHVRETAAVVPLQPWTATETPPGVQLLNALAGSLKRRRAWTYNEQSIAVQLIETHGLERCLSASREMDAADHPVSMLRARLKREQSSAVAQKPVTEMTPDEYQRYCDARRSQRESGRQ